MDEKNSARKYKTLFAIALTLLIAVLCVQGVYWTRNRGKAESGTQAGQQAAEAVQEPTEAASAEQGQAADAGQEATEAELPAETGQEATEVATAAQGQVAETGQESTENASPAKEQDAQSFDRGSLSREGYTLEQVVVMSRHNIRSPMSGKGSVLDKITPHEWFEWSSNPTELSLRGGAAETIMGQYFRKWLEKEGLFPENYHPEGEAVRIYANSRQRTIATSEFFMSGLLPTANMQVEYNAEFGQMDPAFLPKVNFVTEEYTEDVRAQVEELRGEEIRALADNFELLADVIDFEDSEAYKSGEITGFALDDMELTLEVGEEPKMTGALKTGCSVSDALVLQYLEEPDETKAGFGHTLTQEQWKEISEIKDVYVDILFGTPLLAYNVEHSIMQEIRSELEAEGREFSFLCGHDSNISGIWSCLRISKCDLPDAIETATPIGGKIVFSRWSAPDGKDLMSVDLVYMSADQLRDLSLLDLENPPYILPLELEGLTQIESGLYEAEAVLGRFDEAIAEYDKMREKYGVAEVQEDEVQETGTDSVPESEPELEPEPDTELESEPDTELEPEPEEVELDEAA